MSKRTLFIFLILTSYFSYRAKGQVSYGGVPASFNLLKNARVQLPVLSMEPVDNALLRQSDLQAGSHDKKYTFAKSFDVDISPDNAGVWEKVNGMKIWRVGIRSANAYSLNLLFDKAILPTGAAIFIYSPDHKLVRGAFTANNEQTSGMLPIAPFPGDELVVEYNEPDYAAVAGDLHISKVNHDYKNVLGSRPLGEAGNCNMDVYCQSAIAELKEKQAVVALIISGTDLCTGTLVNNMKRDKTPYMITAGHCIANATNAQQTVLVFNYESPFCGKDGSANGFADQSMTGTILRARSDSLDFALVELEMLPPPEYRPYFVGFDKSKTIPAASKTVHHPQGDVKKVSVDYNPPVISTYTEGARVPNSYWQVVKWYIGTTERGSSGGPLFSDTNLMIGTLTGGKASCGNSIDDYFSMMAFQWNYSSSTTKQLKRWLDPNNTGASAVEALDPYASPFACNQFSDVTAEERYETTKISNGKGYVAGHNSLRISGYAQAFTQTNLTTLSAFSVGIAKAITGVNNSYSKVVFNIYKVNNAGLPGTVLKTVSTPISSLKTGMNLVILNQPLTISGKYFIGFDLNYNNTSDTVVVYNAPSRSSIDKNKAYGYLNGAWEPFYWIPDIAIKSSLLINAYGCASSLVEAPTDTILAGSKQFKIYYPNDPSLQLLYLVNTGAEEYGRITFYDLLGRKISETQRMLGKEPMQLNCSMLASSIYMIGVETISRREVIKVKIIRNQ